MLIGAIVVLYNPSFQEIKNIKDYYQKVDFTYIIDNSSKNNEKEVRDILRDENEHIKYFSFLENIGLCKALNFGMLQAKKDGCEWSLIMDADSSFISDIINVYVSIFKSDPEVAIYAPVHIFDRSNNHEYKGVRSKEWVMTSGCFYKIDTFFEIGGFMEELFVDGLDIDFCYRAKEHGYKIVECGEALIKHHPAETHYAKLLGKTLFKYGKSSPWRYYMQSRSCVWCFLRYRKIGDLIRYLWRWFKILFLFNDKREYIYQMNSGTKEGIKLYKNYRINKHG